MNYGCNTSPCACRFTLSKSQPSCGSSLCSQHQTILPRNYTILSKAKVRADTLAFYKTCISSGCKKVVNLSKILKRRLHINTGTHGSSSGSTVVDDYKQYSKTSLSQCASFVLQDIKAVAKTQNISLHIISSHAPPIYPPHVDIIDAWCFSQMTDTHFQYPSASNLSGLSEEMMLIRKEMAAMKEARARELAATKAKTKELQELKREMAAIKLAKAEESKRKPCPKKRLMRMINL